MPRKPPSKPGRKRRPMDVPEPDVCPSCGSAVWVALTQTGVITLNPFPTTLAGELQARLDGDRSWYIYAGFIDYRDSWSMTHYSPDETPVMAEHRCGRILPIQAEMVTQVYPRRRTNPSDEIPF